MTSHHGDGHGRSPGSGHEHGAHSPDHAHEHEHGDYGHEHEHGDHHHEHEGGAHIHHYHYHEHHHYYYDDDDACECGECDCGGHDHDEHDHGHTHGHDHGEHGHDHEHDHDEHDHDHDHGGISINHHEESTIAVFRKSLARPYAEAVAILESRMRIIAGAVSDRGGVIGHIKAVVIAEGDRCMLSITDAGTLPQKRDLGGDSASFELVCIVFLVEDGELRRIISDAFAEYMEDA